MKQVDTDESVQLRVDGLKAHPLPCGFTLLELLIAMTILALLMVMISQMFDSATSVVTRENRHMDSDWQARALLDRMAVDLGCMLKRQDVDYYLKSAANPQPGNDQLAFYSEVPGYYPATGSQGSVSLVGYRLNASSPQLERLSKGLVWNGVSPTDTPLVFLNGTGSTGGTLASTWPTATSPTAVDADYELTGPQVFRFEYYYTLKGRTVNTTTTLPSLLSDTPWDTRAPLAHTKVDGLLDVAAVVVVIAVMDASSRQNVTDAQLTALGAEMKDFSPTMKTGDLEAQWQAAVDDSKLPRTAASSVRIYGRCYSLNPLSD